MAVMARPTDVCIALERVRLEGLLGVPDAAAGLILFAHGSGSGRLSPRNTFVATALRSVGMATLLFDLLTPEEAADRHNVFDVELLASRLAGATTWARQQPSIRGLGIGYFGASTGAAAALIAAATDTSIRAVVSRGGRPDLAMTVLQNVMAPTLLIVGGEDVEVLELNRQALARLRAEKELRIVPGASHLFEEPGTLEEVTRLATDWFTRYLGEPRERR